MNNTHPGESISVWFQNLEMPRYSSLSQNIFTDVCVIGGGIAGLTTAYLLAKEGRPVCLLEAYELASGQSGKTSAHLSNVLDDGLHQLEKYFGKDGLKLAIESHTKALDQIEKIVRQENIDCEFERVSGYLFSSQKDSNKYLKKELEAANHAGLKAEYMDSSPLANFDNGPCLHFPRQAQFNPVKYYRALAKKITDLGGKIFTNSHVVEVQGGTDAFVKTKEGYVVSCQHIVVATNVPINDMFAIHTKQAAYRSYVMGLKVPKASVPKAFFWDTMEPYHYVRTQASDGFDILIVGGEDHKTGQENNPELCYEKLELWAKEKFPMAGEILWHWSGQVIEPVDGLAYIGRNPMDDDNVYVITGDSGHGLTHGTIGGMIITDQIMKRKNPWEKIYNPSRITLRASGHYLKENANVAAQYTEWLETKSKPSFDDLPKNEGVVFRDGTSMVAAYKDGQGKMQYMSAVCPHLAGIVNWNKSEKSWDCPCHGSRFDCHGKVIEGPAFMDLDKIDFTDEETEKASNHILVSDKDDKFFDRNVY
jgi:glycine/D-amino acid oxidase-like deaminating enzyme/nitrite reductase/ring-hydroxylating ferredoxin subunit